MATFTLPKRKVLVRYINTMISPSLSKNNPLYGGLQDGNKRMYCARVDMTGHIMPVLTDEERDAIEAILGYNKGELYHNKQTNNYWHSRYVALSKLDTELDLSNVEHYISYKILLTQPEIAKNYEEVGTNARGFKYYMTSEDDDVIVKSKAREAKMQAYELYKGIENNRSALRAVASIAKNRKINYQTSIDKLNQEVFEFMDNSKERFSNIVTANTFKARQILYNADDCGLLVKRGGGWYTPDGVVLALGKETPSDQTAIDWLTDKSNAAIADSLFKESIKTLEGKAKTTVTSE